MTSTSYHVGEVVAYRSPLLHATVLHRIIGEHGGLFSFKGDANSFRDPLPLSTNAIIGRLQLHIPDVGGWLTWLHTPTNALYFFGSLVLILVGIAVGLFRRQKKVRTNTAPPVRGHGGPGWTLSGVGEAIAIPLVLALTFGLLAAVAFTRPDNRTVAQHIPYQQQLQFVYGGPATKGATYPDAIVTSGDPVFVHLVQSLNIRAHYRFTSNAKTIGLNGTIAMTAELIAANGWTRTISSSPIVAFRGSTANVSLPIDLRNAAGLLTAVNQETGVGDGAASILLTPKVALSGTVVGLPIATSFAPTLNFAFDGLELNLVSAAPSLSSPSFPQLNPSHPGLFVRSANAPAKMSLFGNPVRVSIIRLVSAAGTFAALLMALVVALTVVSRRDEVAQIRARYRQKLVVVTTPPDEGTLAVLDVANFSALVRVAEISNSLILEHTGVRTHTYAVKTGENIYRYQVLVSPRQARESTAAHSKRHARNRKYPGRARKSIEGSGIQLTSGSTE